MIRAQGRVYAREQGGARRWYGDFREYADVGGRQEALVPPGEKRATTDEKLAGILYNRRLEDLERRRRGRVVLGLTSTATLETFAAAHLVSKAKAGNVTERWLASAERQLERAVQFLGADRELATVGVRDVEAWTAQLAEQGLSGGTVRHHLNTLSNLYRRASGQGCVPANYNPVAGLLEKPAARSEEARWLEVPDAALLLEAARMHRPKRDDLAVPFAYQLVAAFLLTGGRAAEVLGLEVGDVSFDRRTVTFRTNAWRRLKTKGSARVVALWPQLEEILRPYVFGAGAPPGQLLFPSWRTGRETMLTDFRKLLDAVARRGGWAPGDVTSKVFRHTYCAARLQTLDQGAPVAMYTVQRELGHGSPAMVQRVYAHLGEVRHRSPVVEYRAEQHAAKLGDRLRVVTAGGTVGIDQQPRVANLLSSHLRP